MSEFWNSKHIKKARKDHPCQFCQLKITKGTSYFRESGLNDGDFSDFGLHPECAFYIDKGERVQGEVFYFSPFKEQRSVPALYALENGSKELKEEIKANLKIEGIKTEGL